MTECPESLQVVVNGKNSVLLSWEPVDDAISYRVYRRISGSADFKFVTDTEAAYYTDSQPEPGSYDYQVTALGPHGESAGIIFLAAAVPAESISLSPPKITSVSRLDMATNVLFFSDENTDCEYEILRQDASGNWITIGKTADHIYYDIAASENGSYYYKVLAAGTDGETAESEIAAENTNPKTVFGVPVLMYHEFVTQEDLNSGIAFDEYAIYSHEFEHDLKWLQENGYTTITVRELAQYLSGQGEMPEKPVILTIDDGKLGVYKNAFPLLQKYNMKAVLAVIGTEIHAASEAPELRAENTAPYCTWVELAEMSASGHVEIASHSYGFHVYQHDGRIGADCGEPDTMADFRMDAYKDFRTLQTCLKNYDIPAAVTFAYPYSERSVPADEVWLQCGYQMLLGGNMESVRASRTNFFLQEAGLNAHSSVLRRIARMHGTPIEDYIG
ncbi:MAG: polysaccharide deacetylase family protein [Oscillibacter sp.]|nr:polysaccharide deacetylase family protein [Oscillibacter sp.]